MKEETNLGHDDKLFPGQVKLLDCISKDDFRVTVGIYLDNVNSQDGLVIVMYIGAYVGCVERLNPSLVTARVLLVNSDFSDLVRAHIRIFDVLDSLFFVQDPLLPALQAVLHGTQDNFGNFQPRVSQANYKKPVPVQ